jgi:hypothetical protein
MKENMTTNNKPAFEIFVVREATTFTNSYAAFGVSPLRELAQAFGVISLICQLVMEGKRGGGVFLNG